MVEDNEEMTTIQVSKNVVRQLERFKKHPRQPFNEVVQELLLEKKENEHGDEKDENTKHCNK